MHRVANGLQMRISRIDLRLLQDTFGVVEAAVCNGGRKRSEINVKRIKNQKKMKSRRYLIVAAI